MLVFSNTRKGIRYSHYAVYVGREHLEGKTPDQNIFEMTGMTSWILNNYYKIFWILSYPYAFIKLWTMNHFSTDKPAGCRFFTVQSFRRHNYMDKSMQPQSKQDMIRTIQELMQKDVCQKYSLTKGNCEHFATRVRYGESFCKQVWHRGNVKIDH